MLSYIYYRAEYYCMVQITTIAGHGRFLQ